MKTEVKRNLDKTYLLIEEAGIYEEDYQMHMLRENKIPGLLEVRGRGAGENSQYYYDISCKVSMKTKYEKIPIGYEELKAFLYQLLTVMKEMKKYFLSENKVILNPEFIYYEKGVFFFCFLPRYAKETTNEFRHLAEYFVSRAEYQEKECVFLAYELHKISMQENYSMKQIQMLMETDWKEQMEQLKSQQKGYVTEEVILDETGWEAGENIVLREKDGWFVEWKKHTKKIFSKKKKWGEWDELEMFRDDDTV